MIIRRLRKRQIIISLIMMIGSVSCTATTPTLTEIKTAIATSTRIVLPIVVPESTIMGTLVTPITGVVKKTPMETTTPKPISTPEYYVTPIADEKILTALTTLDALVAKDPDLGKYYSWECTLYPCYTSGLGLSPNGLWATFFSVDDSGGLKIVSVDGTIKWEIYYSELSGMACPCGSALVEIYHWSDDGKYLYLNPDMMADGGDDWFWGNYVKLIRFDLFNGTWVDTNMGTAASFSPNDKLLAYRSAGGIHVHELENEKEKIFPVSDAFVNYGRFVWSPDSSKIIYTAAKEVLERGENQIGLTIKLLNLVDSTEKTILLDDMRFIYPVEWTDPNRIIFDNLYDWQQYQFDLETNELTPIESREYQ